MIPTVVYDAYWRFAAERHAMYLRRLEGGAGPWTADAILQSYRFTNTYRASDRVSQFLIGQIQYAAHRSQATQEVFFRTILFKLFNKIDTWRILEDQFGPLTWQSVDLSAIDSFLTDMITGGTRIYSAAYIMPPPSLGGERKHTNHLRLLQMMMEDGLPAKIEHAGSLAAIYDLLLPYPGIGKFLAFQYVIDLNYADFLDLEESEFVVAGPGALDGIAKCFEDIGNSSPESVIHEMVDRQEREFNRLGLDFEGLFGRRLQPIDCQNLFCEISKYARAAHPQIRGVSDRTRIKQTYKREAEPLGQPFYPPRWALPVPAFSQLRWPSQQLGLFDHAAA